MKLLRLNPTGLFSFTEHGYIDLGNKGIVLLRGANGSGKSSLLDCACEVLFGTSPKREGAADVTENDITNRYLKQSFGVVEFEHLGHYYRIAYLRNWKGPSLLTGPSAQDEAGGYSGTTVYFERWSGEAWVQKDHDGRDLRMARMADTWKRVVEVTGVDFHMFCNSSYVAQDKALMFIRGKNSEREEILTKLMRLGVYDEAEERAKERASIARQQAGQTQSAITTLQVQEQSIVLGDPAEARSRVDQVGRAIATIDATVVELDRKILAVRLAADANALDATRLQGEMAVVVERIHALAAESQRCQADVVGVRRNAAASVSALPVTDKEFDAARSRLVSVQAAANLENRRLSAMLPGAGKCPSCGSLLDEATLGRHKHEQEEVVNLAAQSVQVAEKEVVVERVRLESARAEKAAEIEASANKQVAEIEAVVTAKMAEVLRLEAEKSDLQAQIVQRNAKAMSSQSTALEEQKRGFLVERRRLDTELANAQAAIQLHDQRVADHARLVAAREEKERQLADVTLEMQEWGWLAKHFPRVKQMKFATGSAFLNEALARHLEVLTDGTTRVVLNPFKAKKEAAKKKPAELTADDYIFKFELVVEEGRKEGVPIQLYSGGERERIVLALVMAFWELAASQGGGTNVLLLDEAFSFLDEKSIERVVRMVERLREKVDTLVLICHDQALASLLFPDKVWTAVKREDDTTVIEVH